jgi:hypothetical protein
MERNDLFVLAAGFLLNHSQEWWWADKAGGIP